MSVSRFYLHVVGCLLIGYAILDKGFAYFGVAPIYVGEMVLAIGIFSLLMGSVSARVVKSPMVWALMLMCLWGLLRTLPYLDTYGILAIRDSVIWLYALYAIFVAGALLKSQSLNLVPRWYGAFFPWFLVLAPVAFIITEKFLYAVPNFPGTQTPIIWMKAGDMSVHLAGVATFMGLGLHRYVWKRQSNIKEFVLWSILAFDIIAAGSRNRGGFLAVIVACLVMMLFKPMNRMNRFIVPGLLILMLALVFDLRIPVGGGRDISVQQILTNVQSVVGKSEKESLEGTVSWRLAWWQRIKDDTILGDHFWLGRGFGVDLASIGGFEDGTGNRSPHNAHLTILARSGVPGMVLWLVFLGVVGASLTQGYFRAQAAGLDVLAKLNVWVLCYWTAYLVNASFDVYLEGPQGGIWFWCVTGFAIALNIEQRVLMARPRRSVRPHRAAARS